VRRSAWFSGLVVGVAAGILTLELPLPGWVIVLAFAVGGLVYRARLAAVAGLVTGLDLAWVALIGRVALTCQATGQELGCHAPEILPWLASGAGILASGLVTSSVAWWRGRP
jgi:hypothetical protein